MEELNDESSPIVLGNIEKTQKKPKLSLKFNLKDIEENEGNLNTKQEIISEEESLGYKSNYKIFQTNCINKDGQNLKDISNKRKASTLSTSISQNDICSDANRLSPTNENRQIVFERKMTNPQNSNFFYRRERLNSTPVTTYFEGVDFYLRTQQPEKERYKKSYNFIEKEKYYKDFNIYCKYYKYKSFDL